MNKYDVFCKGPFPDGRPHECWVQVAVLELPPGQDPRKQLRKYMCSVCGTAEAVIRPLALRNRIPWWDQDYRKSVIAALETPARIFPFVKNPHDRPDVYDDWAMRQNIAVISALMPLLKHKIKERELVRRIVRTKRLQTVTG